ncbi:retrovirus-related pol polyprotein from transposon TNT 1-94 [Tanacetum coccineum]
MLQMFNLLLLLSMTDCLDRPLVSGLQMFPKHMTGNRSQLMNFISKFMGTVRFRKSTSAKIIGYDDYQQGNVFISRVYYVEGLRHNLFSIGKFCDADLEDHPIANVIDDPSRSVSTRKQLKADAMWCYFNVFLTSVKPKNFKQEMTKPSWIDAMQEEIHEFERLQGSERGGTGTCFEVSFRPVARIDAHVFHRTMQANKNITYSKSDVKNGFLKWQAQGRGAVDPTLFTRKQKDYLLFKMSMMGQISFFLGLQISQSPRGIFLNQSKYASEIIKKYGLLSSDSVDTHMVEKNNLDKDLQGTLVDATLYHGMIGSLMYLTSSRPDLIYAVYLCARGTLLCSDGISTGWHLYQTVAKRKIQLLDQKAGYEKLVSGPLTHFLALTEERRRSNGGNS